MHRVALALLVGAALLFVASRVAPWPPVVAGYVGAFAEAALIGGIADWFAVVALFRHPLGLPIPHTAIVPNNKDRIGQALADFVQTHFFSREALDRHLRGRRIADEIVSLLDDPALVRGIAERVRGVLPSVVAYLDDTDAKALVHDELVRAFRRMDGGPLLARLLTALLDDGRREKLFEGALRYAFEWLEIAEPELRLRIRARSGWLGRRLGLDERVADRVLEGVEAMLLDVAEDPAHPWRARYAEFLDELLRDVEDGTRFEETIAAAKEALLDHPVFARIVDDVWASARAHIEDAATREDSRLQATIERGITTFVARLHDDAEARTRFDTWAREVLVDVAFGARGFASSLIEETVRGWDAATISARLEAAVGRDLQFVRVNGTLIGGAIGLLLHAVSSALPG